MQQPINNSPQHQHLIAKAQELGVRGNFYRTPQQQQQQSRVSQPLEQARQYIRNKHLKKK